MGTALLALCFCALSLVLALFVGISPISDKAKVRFMYVGAALSLMAVPMMSHYIAGLNDIVDELRYQAVLVFIVVVCCYCFVMANMVKYNVLKKKVAVLEDTVEKLLTSSLRTPKIFIKEFGDFLMSCHQHCLGVNLLVQR